MSGNSKEYKALVNCMNELEIALQSDREVVHFLFKEGLINSELRGNVLDPKNKWTALEKSGLLAIAIEEKVKLSARNYRIVVNYLRSKDKYKEVVEKLDEEYSKQEPQGK